jgi:hypothetical protein
LISFALPFASASLRLSASNKRAWTIRAYVDGLPTQAGFRRSQSVVTSASAVT